MSEDRWVRVPTDAQTKDLIKQLKDRGYLVVHRDSVRTIGISRHVNKSLLLRAYYATEDLVRKEMAHSLATELLQRRDFPIREYSREICTVEYRAELTWLGSRVSVEDNEYPLFLQRG